MKTDKEWDARARELLRRTEGFISIDIETAALQLGREMADERAEEIARAIDGASRICGTGPTAHHFMPDCAAIARSTITKPKEPKPTTETVVEIRSGESIAAWTEAAIRADEREKVAHEIDGIVTATKHADAHTVKCEAVRIARGTKPKTREQVLEEALRACVGFWPCLFASRGSLSSNKSTGSPDTRWSGSRSEPQA